MDRFLDDAITNLEKANAELEPELLSAAAARAALARYARAEKLAAYGKTVLARRVHDAETVARATGTSVGRAKATLQTGEALAQADAVRDAFRSGRVSGDQAAEIAKAEVAQPGSADGLLELAGKESFQVLREAARKTVLEAEQHRGLGERQRRARSARSFTDDLGMVDLHLRLQPHVGTPIVARAEAEALRRFRAAKKAAARGGNAPGATDPQEASGTGSSGSQGEPTALEPFECHLADAYAAMLAGSDVKGRAKRPELVVLVSHEVTQRGWAEVREGELCTIPGVGPIPPQVAKEIAGDAFLNGVFYDGTDLRHFKRWTRNTPVEVRVALELGAPPRGGLGRTAGLGGFDGVRCVECGRRHRPESDHEDPHVRGGPASTGNLRWRCDPCHETKTARDRKAGKLKPRGP